MRSIRPLIERAKEASRILSGLDPSRKTSVLLDMAKAIKDNHEIIIKLNGEDMRNGKAMHLAPLAIDQLLLDEHRLGEISEVIADIAALPEPLILTDDKGVMANPRGVVAIVYESRPHITADTACLYFKAGNAVILRGGKEAFHSNTVIASILCDVLDSHGLPRELITLIPATDRVVMAELLKLNDLVDMLIPCGSEGLIQYVV
ncbi:MAG: aldehyde dehydrogenase family protein, partial [Candidatus Marinimicrobia bacterium]|nr:aldehyde dehydrogenase family protein [Candidatus Neomarinimicrobiota bacterium]